MYIYNVTVCKQCIFYRILQIFNVKCEVVILQSLSRGSYIEKSQVG